MGQHPLYHPSPHPEALESLSLVHNPPTENQSANYGHQQPPQNGPSRQLPSQGNDVSITQHHSEPSRQTLHSGVAPSQQGFGHELSPGGPRGSFENDRPRSESAGLRDISGQVSNSLNRPRTPAGSSYLNGRPSLPTPQSIPSSTRQYSDRSSGTGNAAGNIVSDHSSRPPALSSSGTRHDLRADSSSGRISQNNHSDGSSYDTMTPTPVPPGVNDALPPHRAPSRPPNPVGPSPSPVSSQRDMPPRSHTTSGPVSSQPFRTEPPVLLKRSEAQVMEGRMALPGNSVPSPQDQHASRPRDPGLRPHDADIRERKTSRETPRPYVSLHDAYVSPSAPSLERRPDNPPLDTNETRTGHPAGSARTYDRSSPPSDHILDLYGQGPRDSRRQDQYDSHYLDDLRRGGPEYRGDYRGRRPLDTRQASVVQSRNYPSPRRSDRDPFPSDRSVSGDDKHSENLPPPLDRPMPPPHGAGRPISSEDAVHASDGSARAREVSSTRPYEIRRDPPAPYRQGRQNYIQDSRPHVPVSSEARLFDGGHEAFPPGSRRPPSPARSFRRDPEFNESASYPTDRPRSREWHPPDNRDRLASFQTGPNSRAGWTNGDRRGDDTARHDRDGRDRLPPLPSTDSMKRAREDDYDLGPKRFPPPPPSVAIRGASPSPLWNKRSRSSSRGPGPRGPDPYTNHRDSFGSVDGLSTRQAPLEEPAPRIRPRSMSPPTVYSRPVYPPGPRPSIPESDAARSAKRARLDDGYERMAYRPSDFPDDYRFDARMEDRRGALPPRPPDNRRGPYGPPRRGGPPSPPPMRDTVREGPGRNPPYLPPRPRSPLQSSASYRGSPRDIASGSKYPPRLGTPPYPPGWGRNDRDTPRYPPHSP
jgi:hypothetical protein